MMIIAIGLLGLMGVQVRSLSTIALAGQRQAASQLANRAMEQLRALPYGTVVGGMVCSDLSGDTNVVVVTTASGCTASFRPTYDGTINETLVTQTGTQVAPINPHRQLATSTKIGSTQYDVRAYVSRVNADPTVDAGYWLTVASTWTSSATGGATKRLATRSQLYSPKGCLALTTHPFSGPCQAFHYTDAGSAGGGLSVSASRPGLAIVDGLDAVEGTVTAPGLSTRVQSEQVLSAQSQSVTSGATLTRTSGTTDRQGAAAGSSAADTDPATGTATSPGSATQVGSSGASPLISTGTGGVFTLSPDGTATGSALSTMAAASSPACDDDSGTSIINGQACSAARANAVGGISSILTLQSLKPSTVTLTDRPFGLANVAGTGTLIRAWGGRFPTGTAAHCTTAAGVGCAGAGVGRALGTASVGGLASLNLGDIIRDASGVDVSALFGSSQNLTPLVTVTSYSDAAQAESGLGVRNPLPAPSRTGTLSYWNGSGFTPVNLATTGAATYTVPTVRATYGDPAVGLTVIEASGAVTVSAPASVAAGSSPCTAAACDLKATGGSVVSKISYTVTEVDPGGSQRVTGKFGVTLDLGTALAHTTYKAAPLA